MSGLCLALRAHGVLTGDGHRYALAPPYALLAASDAAIPLASVIRYDSMVRGTLAEVGSASAYTTLSSSGMLSMAEGSGVSAMSTSMLVAPDIIGGALPEVDATLRAGARHLEVGCGVGNALFGLVSYYPGVTAVGIELDPSVAQEARRRGEALGLAGRVEVRTADAATLADEGEYDSVQWSQFFFPAASRAPVLRAMSRAMKPGPISSHPGWGRWTVGDRAGGR